MQSFPLWKLSGFFVSPCVLVPGIRENMVVDRPVQLADLASTLGALLGSGRCGSFGASATAHHPGAVHAPPAPAAYE